MQKEKSGETMFVVGYVRVSTENQLENYSIDEQTQRLEAYCAAKGWKLVHTYIDGGYSGGNTDRPALKQMLQSIAEGHVDAVVVYKLDRLSRSQKDTLTLIEDEFLSHGTDFVSINENFDTSTPFGRAMIGILSVFAQLEKDQITERFTMGRIGRSKAGYYHGGSSIPTGYDYKDGLLVVNEYEAIQIRELFSRFIAGHSINAICRDFSERYTTRWSPAKILYALQNTNYIGKVHFLKQDYDGIHQPLVDESIFREANRLLKSPEREAKKTNYQKTPFRASYLLSGLVFCGRCGARYSANHGYYKCYSRSKASKQFIKDPNCKNDHWKIEDLDQYVRRWTDALVTDPAVLESVIKTASATQQPQVDFAAAERRITEIDTQVKKLLDLYQVGTIPIETISERMNALSSERNELIASIAQTDRTPSTERFLKALDGYRNGFRDGDTTERRMLLSSLIERVLIDGQSIKIRWRL